MGKLWSREVTILDQQSRSAPKQNPANLTALTGQSRSRSHIKAIVRKNLSWTSHRSQEPGTPQYSFKPLAYAYCMVEAHLSPISQEKLAKGYASKWWRTGYCLHIALLTSLALDRRYRNDRREVDRDFCEGR